MKCTNVVVVASLPQKTIACTIVVVPSPNFNLDQTISLASSKIAFFCFITERLYYLASGLHCGVEATFCPPLLLYEKWKETSYLKNR